MAAKNVVNVKAAGASSRPVGVSTKLPKWQQRQVQTLQEADITDGPG